MFLNWLYHRYKETFWNLMVQDFYGEIPEHVKEPSIEFLANARPTLERFWSIQAYNIQRRSISDPKNAQIYQGLLLGIRTLLAVVSKGKIGTRPEVKEKSEEEKDNPLKRIEDFIKLGKTKNKEHGSN